MRQSKLKTNRNEAGAALAITLMVMVMLLGFAALILTRTVSETAITSNDTAESRTFNAGEAALEDATRDFATVVENKLIPTPQDITNIQNKPVPFFSTNGYTFTKIITQLRAAQVVTQTKGQYQGLISLRDEWQIDITTRHDATGVETQVRRRFFNDRIPVFQFGAFYQDDLEVTNPPTFLFNGRVHTNGNFFVHSNGNDIRFKSKITVGGELIRDIWKNGAAQTSSEQSAAVYAQNTLNVDTQLPNNRGSVSCSQGSGGILRDNMGRNFPYPNCVRNPNWASFSQNFEGNVVTSAKQLTLPLDRLPAPLIEMVRRGKNYGDMENVSGSVINVTTARDERGILARERYANKEGIRISLADSRSRLPQCATVLSTNPCGVRLDGTYGSSLGYVPRPMTDYQATAVNGNRLAVNGREVWIKIELVTFDYDNEKPISTDVTEDILSLGVTEPVINSSTTSLTVPGYTTANDSRSIVKLQRFVIPGPAIPNSTTSYVSNYTVNSKSLNLVTRFKNVATSVTNPATQCTGSACTADDAFTASILNSGTSSTTTNESAHYKIATINGTAQANRYVIVPFPIQMHDTREGNRDDDAAGLSTGNVYKNGVMSIVDIDVANLRAFLNGTHDGKLPNNTPYAISKGNVGLRSTDVPQNRGWVVYVSDRRGDYNFDGRYNMEDVNPNSNSLIEEDLDGNGAVDTDYSNEAPNADSEVNAAKSSVTDHAFYRRSVRLINAVTLPGIYDATVSTNTRGFTFASENSVYTQGNFNATSVAVAGGTNVSTSDKYAPYNSSLHIPASIASDLVTVLSSAWNDAQSFASPNAPANRVANDTQVRFAMLAGDPITGYSPSAGLTGNQNGGLINFPRYLETWSSKRFNYSGSFINLYNAFNSNARHKCCNAVYSPPSRDWTFEESFKDPSRLPPGTPYVYLISFTGFERVND
ncbi:MAG: hypothetical protein IPK58_22465 [Acidobacteria bacterium]|nr:hypothetical protein [Acidobacteriota bacterium]